MELTMRIYKLTGAFPTEERYGITSQLRRAAVSIPSHLAEGNGRVSGEELMQFVGHARGSVFEVQTQLEIAAMLGIGDKRELSEAESLTDELLRILNASLATMRAAAARERPAK